MLNKLALIASEVEQLKEKLQLAQQRAEQIKLVEDLIIPDARRRVQEEQSLANRNLVQKQQEHEALLLEIVRKRYKIDEAISEDLKKVHTALGQMLAKADSVESAVSLRRQLLSSAAATLSVAEQLNTRFDNLLRAVKKDSPPVPKPIVSAVPPPVVRVGDNVRYTYDEINGSQKGERLVVLSKGNETASDKGSIGVGSPLGTFLFDKPLGFVGCFRSSGASFTIKIIAINGQRSPA